MPDYVEDVRRYDSGASADVVDKIVKHLGIALRNRDSSTVSTSDPKEVDRVRDSWGVKKLGADKETAQASVATVAKEMAGDRSKNRVTFYYLVAKDLDKLGTI